MKIIAISLCVGFALLGSGACGKAENTPSSAGGAASGANGDSDSPSSVAGASSGGSPANAGSRSNAGSGATTVDAGAAGLAEPSPEAGGAPSESGPHLCMPDETTTISGVVFDPAGKKPIIQRDGVRARSELTAAGLGQCSGRLWLHAVAACADAPEARHYG